MLRTNALLSLISICWTRAFLNTLLKIFMQITIATVLDNVNTFNSLVFELG